MFRTFSLLSLLAAAACASDVVTTGSGDAGELADPGVGLYHLPNHADAINLELRDDHSFRWSLAGCDTFGGAKGRVMVESPSRILLLPEGGTPTFLWIGEIAVSQVASVQLEVSKDHLIEHGGAAQTWLPGGVCAICGGNLGPTGQKPCDEPSFF